LSVVNGTWYDTEINGTYGEHEFILLPNELGINIVKCKNCNVSRMYLSLFDKTSCDTIEVDGS